MSEPGTPEMSSSRPYLIRALYEWILDNDRTPYLLVSATHPGVVVPTQYVNEGRIVLNLAPRAIQSLDLGNDWVSFNARFGGQSMQVSFPVTAVLAIYAQENGQGMMFPEAEEPAEPPADQAPGEGPPDDDGGPDAPGPRPGGRPRLKVVK